jgi:molybdopterin-guanine dinucleotide biosynthesis protein A
MEKSWGYSEVRNTDAAIDTVGLILAGGQARRMGGTDKALLMLGGETLIARTAARAKTQVGQLLINANGDPSRFASFGSPVIADRISGFLGPLAGILSGLEWMRTNRPKANWLATFSCDCPFFPRDLVERLIAKAQRESVSVAVAASGGRHHPVFAVWRADLPVTAQSVLNDQGLRKMDDFVARFSNTRLNFPSEPVDPFFNINMPDDLARAETLLAKG